MNCQNIILKEKENKVIELTDFSDLNIELLQDSKLVLKLANFAENKEIKIYGKIGKYAGISVVFAPPVVATEEVVP